MKRLKLKMFLGILLALVMTGVFFAAVYISGVRSLAQTEMAQTGERLKGIQDVFSGMAELSEQALNNFQHNLSTNLELSAGLLAPVVRENPDADPLLFSEGLAAPVRDGKLRLPAGAPGGFPEKIPGDGEEQTDYGYLPLKLDGEEQYCHVLSRRITEEWYYFDWTSLEEEGEYLRRYVDENETREMLSLSYSEIFLMVLNDEKHTIYIGPESLQAYTSLKEMGITDEQLTSQVSTVTIGEDVYTCYAKPIPALNMTVLYLSPGLEHNEQSVTWALIVAVLVLLMLVGITVWLVSVQRMVRDYALTEREAKRYRPSRMRGVTAAVGLICAAAVFAAAGLCQLFYTVHEEVNRDEINLTLLENRLKDHEKRQEALRQEETEWYLYYLEHAAQMMEQSGGLWNQETLKRMTDTLGGEYLTLFDSAGKAVVCSAGYKGFSLGTSENDPTYDFRRLLMGAPGIVRREITDPVLQKSMYMMGVTVPRSDGREYDALILAVDPAQIDSRWAVTGLDDLLLSLAPADHELLMVDRESGEVINANSEEMIGHVINYGDGDTIPEAPIDYYRLGGKRFFGCYRSIEGQPFYLVTETAQMNMNALRYGLTAGVLFLILFVVLAVLMLLGYTQKAFDANVYVGGERHSGTTLEIVLPDGRRKKTIDPSRRWALFFVPWKYLRPGEKTRVVLRVLGGVLLAFTLWNVYRDSQNGQSTLLSFLLEWRWKRGFNLFAVCGILLVAIALVVALSLCRFLLRLLGNVMGAKGETVCRLLYNGLHYAVYIAILFIAFSFLGIDTTALLAGVSLLSLAVSLGAKDLVSDILAGIFIVFESEFEVGDMVDIGGYLGIVQDIGIRTTKLLSAGNDVKIMSNRDVRNVINKSRLHSWCTVDFLLPVDANLDQVEDMLNRRLPEVRRAIPEILSGPYYRGIRDMVRGNMTVSVSAECDQQDYNTIQRGMTREIWRIMHEEGFPLS